jgi:hypothetical protein
MAIALDWEDLVILEWDSEGTSLEEMRLAAGNNFGMVGTVDVAAMKDVVDTVALDRMHIAEDNTDAVSPEGILVVGIEVPVDRSPPLDMH